MIDDRVILAVGITLFGLVMVTFYVAGEVRSYHAHRDPRALRSMIAAMTMVGMTFAIIGRSPTLREHFLPEWPVLFGFLTTSGLAMALVGLAFLTVTSLRIRRRGNGRDG